MMPVDNKIGPISTIETGSKQDARPPTQEAFAQEDQIQAVLRLHGFLNITVFLN
jgi:hypothetical protein